MKLKIPFHYQNKDYTCGPASLQMVFSFFGKYEEQGKLAKMMHTTSENGTCHSQLIDAAREEGFYCYVNNNSTIDEVKHFVSEGLPVVVHYKEPSDEEGHYAVISGYGKEFITFNDPWNGKNFRISEDNFISRWHDCLNNHASTKWVLVISKEDFHLGKQYLPHSLNKNSKT